MRKFRVLTTNQINYRIYISINEIFNLKVGSILSFDSQLFIKNDIFELDADENEIIHNFIQQLGLQISEIEELE